MSGDDEAHELRATVEVDYGPDGWTRITRRALDGSGGLLLVDAVVSEGADGYHQRWRDGTEIPA